MEFSFLFKYGILTIKEKLFGEDGTILMNKKDTKINRNEDVYKRQVKNSYGFVYGFHKAKGHTQYPSADSFARMLIDLNKCVAPKLYVMDGIVAMEEIGRAHV